MVRRRAFVSVVSVGQDEDEDGGDQESSSDEGGPSDDFQCAAPTEDDLHQGGPPTEAGHCFGRAAEAALPPPTVQRKRLKIDLGRGKAGKCKVTTPTTSTHSCNPPASPVARERTSQRPTKKWPS